MLDASAVLGVAAVLLAGRPCDVGISEGQELFRLQAAHRRSGRDAGPLQEYLRAGPDVPDVGADGLGGPRKELLAQMQERVARIAVQVPAAVVPRRQPDPVQPISLRRGARGVVGGG